MNPIRAAYVDSRDETDRWSGRQGLVALGAAARSSRACPGSMRWGPLTGELDVREAYALHSNELYGLAVSALGEARLAEQALEETFLRAWKERERLDPEVDGLRTWLFTILRDVLIHMGHPRAGAAAVAEGGIEQSAAAFEQSFVAWQIEEAMRRIDERYRQVLVETYYRGRSNAEVATELGVSEVTVRSRVHDGLRALNVALEKIAF
jgi:RNA polymerase sigma-70 factor (ECF subfamily)